MDNPFRLDSVFEFSLPFQTSPHPLASLSFLHSLSFAGLKIDGVFFDLLDNGFLLDFSFEASKSALQGFSFFDNYEGQ